MLDPFEEISPEVMQAGIDGIEDFLNAEAQRRNSQESQEDADQKHDLHCQQKIAALLKEKGLDLEIPKGRYIIDEFNDTSQEIQNERETLDGLEVNEQAFGKSNAMGHLVHSVVMTILQNRQEILFCALKISDCMPGGDREEDVLDEFTQETAGQISQHPEINDTQRVALLQTLEIVVGAEKYQAAISSLFTSSALADQNSTQTRQLEETDRAIARRAEIRKLAVDHLGPGVFNQDDWGRFFNQLRSVDRLISLPEANFMLEQEVGILQRIGKKVGLDDGQISSLLKRLRERQ